MEIYRICGVVDKRLIIKMIALVPNVKVDDSFLLIHIRRKFFNRFWWIKTCSERITIFYIIRGTAVFRRQSSCSDSSLRWTDGEKAAINTLIIVLACFVICWLPYLFYTNYVFFTADKDSIPAFLNPLAYYFGFTNSACNPVIYAFRFPDFKRGYIEILQKFTCCSRSTACESVQKTDGYLREKIDLIDNKADKTKISKDNIQ
ncbi:unnamed protein product [Mytilus coruscus]|uniref:G-protein coupled receptors family 1 profile domain-containing protein n=1 Tax=Mytilus coruscus TaxID=42192 RepID=A0A6J8CZP8_MYTCO|nr:unnamed protein product [Mytilus coruscus]